MKQVINFLIISFLLTSTYAQETISIPDEFLSWTTYYQNLFDKADGDLQKLKGTGFMPFVRGKVFMEQRLMHDGSHAYEQAWENYLLSKRQRLTLRNGSPVAQWKSIGPSQMNQFGGRTISHSFDPVDPNTIYAGSASGGLWKTSNQGESWNNITPELPSTGVGGVAVNPQNPQEIVIGTGEGYAVNMFIRPGIGIFYSEDGGQNWKESTFQFPQSQGVSVLRVAWDYENENNVYAATTSGLWVSRDKGKSWFFKLGGNIADEVVIHPSDPSILYSVLENDGVYKSTDFGENWVRLNQDLPSPGVINFGRLAICRDQPSTIYASLTRASDLGLEGLYRSDDDGNSWKKLDKAPNAFCSPQSLGFGCQGWYNNTVGVAPDNPDHVFLGGVTFWRSVDGGERWFQMDVYSGTTIPLTTGKTYVDQHDFGFSPHDDKLAFVFNDGGVSIARDGGSRWTPINKGMRNAQLYTINSPITDPDLVIGGFQDHGLQGTNTRERKNGEWNRWGAFDGGDVIVDPNNTNIFYGVWLNGQIVKTTQGLSNYSPFFIDSGVEAVPGFFGFNPLVMSPEDSKLLLYATTQRIYKSTTGSFWRAAAEIPNVRKIAFDQVNPNIVYAASFSVSAGTWAFWRSEDAGDNWVQTPNSPGWRVTDIQTHPHKEGVLWATRNSAFPGNPHVYYSEDYGNTWRPLISNLPDIIVNTIAVNHYNDNILYLGTDLGVYISENGGDSWTPFNDGMPVSICLELQFHPADTSLRVATYGSSAWKTKTSTTVVSAQNILSELSQVHIFPNPSMGQFAVELLATEKVTLSMDLFDGKGRRVAVLGNVVLEKNVKKKIEMKPGLPAGQYYLRFKNLTHTKSYPIQIIE